MRKKLIKVYLLWQSACAAALQPSAVPFEGWRFADQGLLFPPASATQPPRRGCWGRPGGGRCSRRPSSRPRSTAAAVSSAKFALHWNHTKNILISMINSTSNLFGLQFRDTWKFCSSLCTLIVYLIFTVENVYIFCIYGSALQECCCVFYSPAPSNQRLHV